MGVREGVEFICDRERSETALTTRPGGAVTVPVVEGDGAEKVDAEHCRRLRA